MSSLIHLFTTDGLGALQSLLPLDRTVVIFPVTFYFGILDLSLTATSLRLSSLATSLLGHPGGGGLESSGTATVLGVSVADLDVRVLVGSLESGESRLAGRVGEKASISDRFE